MQIRHRPETQTLYAQLYELVAAHELDLVGGFATGLAIEREVRGRLYLYWQLRDSRVAYARSISARRPIPQPASCATRLPPTRTGALR